MCGRCQEQKTYGLDGNKNNLSKLKEKCILLNLGRGGIINEMDLAKIIDEKNIYVGLDVTKIEPIEEEN
ncbi:MAG TPA: hypothetical protein EYP06_09620, partial [Desulfobacterales bacterium]|nr:hypothetical protein [Desulfobacterales bacterium]